MKPSFLQLAALNFLAVSTLQLLNLCQSVRNYCSKILQENFHCSLLIRDFYLRKANKLLPHISHLCPSYLFHYLLKPWFEKIPESLFRARKHPSVTSFQPKASICHCSCLKNAKVQVAVLLWVCLPGAERGLSKLTGLWMGKRDMKSTGQHKVSFPLPITSSGNDEKASYGRTHLLWVADHSWGGGEGMVV